MAALTVGNLRSLFRGYQAWRASYEADGIDTVVDPAGVEWSLWDLDYLRSQLFRLPERQRQAIELFLVQNMREEDVAVLMGILPSNPIGLYATEGLRKLIVLIQAGQIIRFRPLYEKEVG